MNPLQKLRSWWRGNADPELEAEAQRLGMRRDTIRISQNTAAKQAGSSLLSAPTPDLLEPTRDERHSH